MAIDMTTMRAYLRAFNLHDLFVEELGWDNPPSRKPLEIQVEGADYRLVPIADKRGMAVYCCEPDAAGRIPTHAQRRKIEKAATESAYEHIIVYVDAARSEQLWQWVKREAGKPAVPREHPYTTGQPGDALLQKLQNLAIAMEDEERLDITGVAGRARQAFDVDRVTKRFYDRFQSEHRAFLDFIAGIQAQGDREWYASLMLNRLMFVYFIQKKGFLDGDTDYLRHRLHLMRERRGHDQFHSFYRYFLLRLFHEGLGQSSRSPELDALLGDVPYLNGGLFDVHQLEQSNSIEIPDAAFERIFAFFDAYQWRLDERPLRADNEINPDVLGYIFEKYINQKQMGAYYTKEDITGYIGQNTIIPYLFDAAEQECAIAFRPDGALWGLLRDDPDRYIYPAVRKGVDLPLPDEIAAGRHDVTRRGGWNRPAEAGYALPTETWREHVARRTRYEELRARLAAGEIARIDDVITANLDIRQLALDAIATCEGPELLRAFYKAIESVTVLDPTCGSGAFLFAALNILQPLYDACLDRMQGFIADFDRAAAAQGHAPNPQRFVDFRKTLAGIEQHANRDYFALKSIIIGNLYGVDIMEEAVEICKLRLFLKLVAQVEPPQKIEPLPDIDFNVRAGNTLVGFASLGEVEAAVGRKFDFDNTMERIREDAEIADRAYRMFRRQQTELGGTVTAADKAALRLHLRALDATLDRYLAGEYGIDTDDADAFAQWRESHKPFHWFVEFYGIMAGGGFDVIIGNPPYVSVRKIDYSFPALRLTRFPDIYAYISLRSADLSKSRGRLGMIVPLSITFSGDFGELRRKLTEQGSSWFSSFDNIPAAVFAGVSQRCTIWIGAKSAGLAKWVSPMYRWRAEYREALTANIGYTRVDIENVASFGIPKLASRAQEQIIIVIKEAGRRANGSLR